MRASTRWGLVLLLALAASCREAETLRDRWTGSTPRERYESGLRDAGIHESALGREWLAAGEAALRAPVEVELPHREAAILPPDEASAVAWSVPLRLGERLTVELEPDSAWSGAAFVELWEPPADEAAAAPRLRASADSLAAGLTWIARRSGRYLVRLQPELLRGGRLTVTLRAGASLGFPVEGRGNDAIGSRFGAPRDGGARDHHGVDIFAPRGTPVVAAADGTVRSVDTTRIGGRVVWMTAREQGVSLYYAHLDQQSVRPGAAVRAGDTLGTVGNTGNAVGTPPHLHFGIYRRGEGPLDPFPFVNTATRDPAPLRADAGALGRWRRTRGDARLALTAEDDTRPLPPNTALRALGASGGRLRVRLPDGMEGFLAENASEPADDPIRTLEPDAPLLLRTAPDPRAPAVAAAPAGAPLPAVAEWNGWTLLRTADGRLGWGRN